MKIYNNTGTLIFNGNVEDNSYTTDGIMAEQSITLYFKSATHIEIPVGSYCDFQNRRYTLLRPENLKMKHSREFEYTVIMKAGAEKAKFWKFRNPVDGRLKFFLTAKPIEHLQMVVDNLNMRESGWTVGDCIDGTEKTINYDHNYILDALAAQASEFKTEYEIKDKVVSLRKVEYNKDNPLSLSYGMGNGFKTGVGRTNESETPPIEVLYVQGGEENIDPSNYGHKELLLPAGGEISYDGNKFEDETGYDASKARTYVVSSDRLSIMRKNATLSTMAEDSLDCSEVYPKRVGTVSEVICVDADKNFYDFTDTSIPDTLNFEDCIIEGEKMTVIFQTGMLAGREFEVKYYHSAIGTTKKARRFEIVPAEIDGETMPNSTYKPAVGNTYAVYKCALPAAYIADSATKTGAEWDMFRIAVKYKFEHEDEKFTFTGTLDGIWAKKDWINIGGRIVIGGFITFSDTRFQPKGVDVRIIAVKQYVNNPHSPVITLSNSTVTGGVSGVLKELQAQEVVIQNSRKETIAYTKRRFRDALETSNMLAAALFDQYTEGIAPISVQTMQMLVGDESLQFRYVDSKTTPQAVADGITYNQTTKQLSAPARIIQHLTLGIKTISPSHSASECMFWNIQAYTSAILTDSSKKYYLYAEVPEDTTQTGQYKLSEAAIEFHTNSKYYLLVGILNSEYEGERSFVTLYGFTEILPSRVTTEKVVSADGTSYFDMQNSSMKLGDVLDYNSNGKKVLKIKGTIVQSESGDESPIGCFRGAYNSTYTYYAGDEVTYANDEGHISSYRYINATPSSGHAPTSTLYWQIIASAGSDGENGYTPQFGTDYFNGKDGSFVSFIYKLSNTSLTPTGGSFDGTTETFPSGWSDDPVYNSTTKTQVSTTKYSKNDDGTWSNNGWSPSVQYNGINGQDGDYFEFRYAVNGSTSTPPSLSQTEASPSGWTTAMPSVGSLQYLWMTSAKKTASGTLVTNWSTPVRVTPEKGATGENAPILVYRGLYDSNSTYYGNAQRVDAVKYNGLYYVARTDDETGSGFNGYLPTNSQYWNTFGAEFESVATNLLLAEGANIGDWFMSGGKIVSTLSNGNKVILDASMAQLIVESSVSGGQNSMNTGYGSTVKMDATTGVIETRAKNAPSFSSGLSYMSPTGIFANLAGTDGTGASTGMTHRGAIVGLGNANTDASVWSKSDVQTIVAGVYGRAYNYGTAPAYGGFFYDLFAAGLILGRRCVEDDDGSVFLGSNESLVIGYSTSQKSVYLPTSPKEGQVVIVRQWWTGTIRLYSRSGYTMYHGNSVISYFEIVSGETCLCTFHVGYINGSKVSAWICDSFKTGA